MTAARPQRTGNFAAAVARMARKGGRPVKYSASSHAAFHAAMHADPHDTTAPQVYADYLEENGMPATAGHIRAAVADGGRPTDWAYAGPDAVGPASARHPRLEPGQFAVMGGTSGGPWIRLLQRRSDDPSRVWFWGHDAHPREGGFPYPAAHRLVKSLVNEGAVPDSSVKWHFIDYIEQNHPKLADDRATPDYGGD
jgi:uncharacterized protein (TIGR02996 family)